MKKFASVLLFILICFSNYFLAAQTVILYQNNFENPLQTPVANCGPDVDLTAVNTLWGGTGLGTGGGGLFEQVFTVETMLINGPSNTYTDPSGVGGNYCIGFQNEYQNDKLALTLNSQQLPFANINFDLSAINLAGCGGFPVALDTTALKITIYDSPGGNFSFTAPGVILDQDSIMGKDAGITDFTFNWSSCNLNLDISNSLDGNITVVFDLFKSGYAGFDNLSISSSVFSQNCAMDLGPDTSFCQGENILLDAGAGFDSYQWQDNSTNQTFTASTTGTYICTASFNDSTNNLVLNGDFELGNTGFLSDYGLGVGGAFGLLTNPSTYAISTSPSNVHNNFFSCVDHTSGAGNLMIINGSNTPNTNVWCQDINVSPNTDYNFSAWVISLENTDLNNVATLNFLIDGVQVGSAFSPSLTACDWQQFSASYNSGINTNIQICIESDVITGNNDYGIDDIFFTPVCIITDSIDITVNPIVQTNSNQVICFGDSLQLPDGSFTTTAGTYNDTIAGGSINGCDSIYSIILQVTPLNPAIVQFDTICFNDNYTLANGLQVNTTGFYQDTIVGSSLCDSVVAVDLFVRQANSILFQSSDLLLCDGEDALFFGESDLLNVSYRWYANGAALLGENNDTLLIPNVSILNDGTSYQLEVISLCDTVNSNATLLNVRSFANIVLNPLDTSLCEGEIATFEVAVDRPILQYRWYENGVAIAGANTSVYNTGPIAAVQNGSQFFVAVTDSCGNIDSSLIANLTVVASTNINNQSSNLIVCVGDLATFYVSATGTNLSYQWLENGIIMPGETNDTLISANTTQAMSGTTYSCQITADCGNLNTLDMELIIEDAGVLLSQSGDVLQCGGFSFELFVDALNVSGYQWQVNQGAGFVDFTDGILGIGSTQVLGSNTDVLTVSNFDLSITGSQFQVITSTNCGASPIFTPVNVAITAPEAGIDLLADTTICLDDTDPIFVSYVDGSAVWSNGDFGQFFTPNSSGDYTVNYTDANACPRSDTINIQLEDCLANCVVTAPTGFTPDASGVNDIFRAIYTCDLSYYELQIYNRFGELVYMTTDPLEGWDGIYKNGNTEIGAYTWYMKYQIEGTNNIEEIKGTITLIR